MRAVVNVPVCPLLTRPDPLSPQADEALYGMAVEVLEQTTPTFWRVRTHYRYEGYAPVSALRFDREGAAAWEALPKRVVFHKTLCDVLSAPRYQAQVLLSLPLGAVAAVTGEAREGWQEVSLVDGRAGYVRESILDTYYDKPIRLPEGALRRRVCETAKRYLGSQYRWGGKTPLGIDCSGLTSMSYLLSGIVIYRDARIMEGFPIRPIRREELRPADLLYFPGHIALYLGEGRYIHSTGRAGSDGVCVNSLAPEDPDYREDLDRQFIVAGTYF